MTVLRGPVEPAQYVLLGFGQSARDAGIAISMGSKGDAYDNAVAESFFATLKKELIHRQSWPTRHTLSAAGYAQQQARHTPWTGGVPCRFKTALHNSCQPAKSFRTVSSQLIWRCQVSLLVEVG